MSIAAARDGGIRKDIDCKLKGLYGSGHNNNSNKEE